MQKSSRYQATAVSFENIDQPMAAMAHGAMNSVGNTAKAADTVTPCFQNIDRSVEDLAGEATEAMQYITTGAETLADSAREVVGSSREASQAVQAVANEANGVQMIGNSLIERIDC
ncbi:hypothetical protein ACJZ2D_009264 [Fusarium nematophilum]